MQIKICVGQHTMEFEYAGFEKYVDDIVEIFENQETINDIEMVPVETPTPPET